jgi:hypothetical protein
LTRASINPALFNFYLQFVKGWGNFDTAGPASSYFELNLYF